MAGRSGRFGKAGPAAAGWVLLVLGLAVSVGGYVHEHGWNTCFIASEFYANVGTTLLGTAIVVLVIDRLSAARAAEARIVQLVRDMASSDNGLAVRAVRDLRALGKVTDGSLDGGDFSRANLEDAPLEEIRARDGRFQGCRLAHADMARADLAGAILNRADLTRCNLEVAVLEDASLVEATLENADCGDAVLRGAKLSGAFVAGADFRGADLRGAALEELDLTGVKMSGAQLGGAIISNSTKLPPDAPATESGPGEYRHWPDDVLWP